MNTPKRKLIDLKHKEDGKLIDAIQEYADTFCAGNFTQAVRQLCTGALLEERMKEQFK